MKLLKRYWWAIGLLLALVVVLFSPLASPYPDGLERVAEDQGFLDRGQEPPYEIVPDYVFPGIGDEGLATILAGIVGTLVVFGLGYGLALVLRRREKGAAPKG